MVTFRAGSVVLFALLAGMTAACSREQQDWRSAEDADTGEAWQRFLEQHPDGELANEARNRIAQLQVRNEFQYADAVGTVEAFRAFLARHPSGAWSERARIRIESFSLGSAPRMGPLTPEEAATFSESRVRALRLATAAAAQGADASTPAAAVQPAALPLGGAPSATGAALPEVVDAQAESATGRAVPGEAAQAATDSVVTPVAATEVGTQSGYGIQLGAFGSEASADREWRRLQGRFGAELGNLSPRIVIAESDSRQLYRLQAPASGEAQARAICDSLREQAQACIPVVPR